jgi:hypothetical protein
LNEPLIVVTIKIEAQKAARREEQEILIANWIADI